ncbi:50S ribosomal protein L22 [Candidatus Aciduliprofundum boonei]|uniref:Large ribosomal subunit protein uL22 n=1 Tax=Aciduliprofundum boonei (strain DSM 19572 / T469) TaxID=439481 RepID=D3TB43_ACIB4|nr:50S ribosomal protein L22 [Candidatus Aciduliprofundum boonei]ADD09322.1 ribosomal protein L22 [Aciduliprofundum boonei T469]HII55209.1 50S ribosomal protein L22 [Candidatus Aciduliprofundum boonei]
MPYSIKVEGDKYAKSYGKDLPISLKDSVNLCRAIKGMRLDEAKDFLEDVINKKRAVPYFRYLDSISHRRGIGPGRYPVKVAKHVLKILENAEANAENNDLDTDNLYIMHIAAHKGRIYKRYVPRAQGRSVEIRREMVNIEVILEERTPEEE